MDFRGPDPADLADVFALNYAVLHLARSSHFGGELRDPLAPDCQPLVVGVTDPQMRRLATVPFLLLSIREGDEDFWSELLRDDPNRDLFAVNDVPANEHDRILAAAVGFLWQLARRNPYATRLVCGGSLHWCERLAACSLFDILRRLTDRRDVLQLRSPADASFWKRLLGAGLSSQSDIRSAAHLCALQGMLTDAGFAERRRLSAAACRTMTPTISM